MFLCGLLPCVDLSFYRIDCFFRAQCAVSLPGVFVVCRVTGSVPERRGEGVCCLFRGTVFHVFYLPAGCNGMEVPLLPGMCVILIRNRL